MPTFSSDLLAVFLQYSFWKRTFIQYSFLCFSSIPPWESGHSCSIPTSRPGHSCSIPTSGPGHFCSIRTSVPGHSCSIPTSVPWHICSIPTSEPGHFCNIFTSEPGHSWGPRGSWCWGREGGGRGWEPCSQICTVKKIVAQMNLSWIVSLRNFVTKWSIIIHTHSPHAHFS